MSELDFQRKFPDLVPVHATPWLGTFNGIGLMLYGHRDDDADTGTYVTTRWFTVLYLPLLALNAYRISSHEGNWYIFGREPLSFAVKLWNMVWASGICVAIGVGAWNSYTHSPSYIAGRTLRQAEQATDAGDLARAAELCGEVMSGDIAQAAAAERLGQLLAGPCRQAAPQQAAAVIRIAAELREQDSALTASWPDLYPLALELAQRHGEADPRGALDLLAVVQPSDDDKEAYQARRQLLLERLVAQNPQDVDALGQLAEIHESRGEFDECKALLQPHCARLGQTEGARILGQVLARDGQIEEAYGLLSPYAETRLARLHTAEEAYEQALSSVRQQAYNDFKAEAAPQELYSRLEEADEAGQQTLIQEYVVGRLEKSREVRAARNALAAEGRVVPVALDLGLVLLRRAQTMPDPGQKRRELERAEKTFLAIRGLAGETDEYRLSLGQVYYWLGKHDEGRKLLEELLQAHQRGAQTLASVAALLRGLGDISEARKLLAEAHEKETDVERRFETARLRARTSIDLDDEIAWLQKSDLNSADTQAAHSGALAKLAARNNDDLAAVGHLRDAVRAYSRLPEDSATLNNSALALLDLYQLSGDKADYTEGMSRLDRAVALNPSDGILLSNAGFVVLESSLREIVGDAIDLKTLKMGADLDVLDYLYRDEAGRRQWASRVGSHEGVRRAVSYFDKGILLRPKSAGVYQALSALYAFRDDTAALETVAARLRDVVIDTADTDQRVLDFVAGKDLEKRLDEAKSGVEWATKRVETTRGTPGGATFAVAATWLCDQLMATAVLGEPVDWKRVVELAEEAESAAPSAETELTLLAALLGRAESELRAQVPQFAGLASASQGLLSGNYLMPIALASPGPLREAVLGHADVQRAGRIAAERTQRLPSSCSPWYWAMLRHLQPESAAKAADATRRNRAGELAREISRRLGPLQPADAYDACWAAELAGKPEDGAEILRALAARGIPLPLHDKE